MNELTTRLKERFLFGSRAPRHMLALVMQEITKQKKENVRTVRKASKPVGISISASAMALLFK